jgi:hypothetical protein
MTTKEYVKENVHEGELSIYRVLSSAALQAYNDGFSTLVLPRAISIDEGQRTLTLPHYEGRTFDDMWGTANGGAPLGISLAREVPLVIQDLSKIDTAHLSRDPALAEVPHLTYDHETGLEYFYGLAGQLHKSGGLTQRELAKTRTLLNLEQTSGKIVNNGDFYPRNLIKMPSGKIVLIDWETWNSHSPFFVIDHPENVAAVQYVHMWGNRRWQDAYLDELDRHFSFSEESLAKGVVMKALSLAHFFPEHERLLRGQIDIIKATLSAGKLR